MAVRKGAPAPESVWGFKGRVSVYVHWVICSFREVALLSQLSLTACTHYWRNGETEGVGDRHRGQGTQKQAFL